MYIIEYVATPKEPQSPVLMSELALANTVEEARDHADLHLKAVSEKCGAKGYRICDRDKNRVAIGPAALVQ